jgi:hypothetical protein
VKEDFELKSMADFTKLFKLSDFVDTEVELKLLPDSELLNRISELEAEQAA